MAAVGEKSITYDARGLAEPIADAPRIAEIANGVARFDAEELTTRTINLELRRLLYEEGVKEVVVDNPGGRHSLGVGIHAQSQVYVSRHVDQVARAGHRAFEVPRARQCAGWHG